MNRSPPPTSPPSGTRAHAATPAAPDLRRRRRLVCGGTPVASDTSCAGRRSRGRVPRRQARVLSHPSVVAEDWIHGGHDLCQHRLVVTARWRSTATCGTFGRRRDVLQTPGGRRPPAMRRRPDRPSTSRSSCPRASIRQCGAWPVGPSNKSSVHVGLMVPHVEDTRAKAPGRRGHRATRLRRPPHRGQRCRTRRPASSASGTHDP